MLVWVLQKKKEFKKTVKSFSLKKKQMKIPDNYIFTFCEYLEKLSDILGDYKTALLMIYDPDLVWLPVVVIKDSSLFYYFCFFYRLLLVFIFFLKSANPSSTFLLPFELAFD